MLTRLGIGSLQTFRPLTFNVRETSLCFMDNLIMWWSAPENSCCDSYSSQVLVVHVGTGFPQSVFVSEILLLKIGWNSVDSIYVVNEKKRNWFQLFCLYVGTHGNYRLRPAVQGYKRRRRPKSTRWFSGMACELEIYCFIQITVN